MNNMQAAYEIIFGEKPDGYYIAGFVFAGLAILLSLYISSKKRDPKSDATPEKFSWWFLIWDNAKRAGATMIVMFILFRVFDLSEIPAMLAVGFGVAICLDQIIEWMIGNFNFMKFLQSNREKFPQIPKQ